MGKARVEQWKRARTKQRRVLGIALGIADLMFFVQLITGFMAQSVSLQADAFDFVDTTTADESIAATRFLSRHKAILILLKGATMAVLALGIAGIAVWNLIHEHVPDAQMMAIVGGVALAANTAALALLWPQRANSSGLKTAWACARYDVIGNAGVLLAALGVLSTGKAWPDVAVAAAMIPFTLRAAWLIVRKGRQELRETAKNQSAKKTLRPVRTKSGKTNP